MGIPVPDEKDEEEKKEAPVAGGSTAAIDGQKEGAFTSVKYSGQPPGGKSSITF